MYLIPFLTVEPELAARETRVLNTLVMRDGLPVGSYGLLEFYCPDPECDCQRVMLNVVEKKQPGHFLASISYAFDPDDEMAGPLLDPLNRQSEYAEKLLQLIEQVVLIDRNYVARLKWHYSLVKQAATDPAHPAYRKIQQTLEKNIFDSPLPFPWKKRAGHNDPCPCGSGKKFKYCCMRNSDGGEQGSPGSAD
jgi:hypothetical protein